MDLWITEEKSGPCDCTGLEPLPSNMSPVMLHRCCMTHSLTYLQMWLHYKVYFTYNSFYLVSFPAHSFRTGASSIINSDKLKGAELHRHNGWACLWLTSFSTLFANCVNSITTLRCQWHTFQHFSHQNGFCFEMQVTTSRVATSQQCCPREGL